MDKIIFGITGLTLGGAERVLVDIANRLVDKYDITIFTIYAKGELEKELNSKIKIISLYKDSYKQLTKINKIIASIKVLLNKKKIYKNYIGNKDYKAQIAFLEGPITRIFGVKCEQQKQTKKIAWIHNDISKVFGKGIKSRVKRIYDRNIYEKYDTLAFVSMDNLDKFNKVYDDILLPHETVIYNYIDSQRILKLSQETIVKQDKEFFDSDEPIFLQVSRLVDQKAIDRLIKVHVKLIRQGNNHKIIIIGDGPLKDKLEKQISEEGVNNSFILLGARQNPYPYIKKADYFCLFSKFEGYPMVIEEAKILKKFIFATNTSAREVLINYKTDNKIVSNDEQGIENAIKYGIQNKKKILQKNINYIYENNKIIDKIIKTIEEQVINKKATMYDIPNKKIK